MAITEKYASPAGAGAHDGTTESDAWSLAEAVSNAVAGERVNFKGTASGLSTFTIATAATATGPMIWRAYASTIGDGGAAAFEFSANQALLLSGMDIVFDGFTVSGDRGAPILDALAYTNNAKVINCRLIQNRVTFGGSAVAMQGGSLVNCYVESACTGTGLLNGAVTLGRYSEMVGCFVQAAGNAVDFSTTFPSSRVARCILAGAGTSGSSGIRLNDPSSYVEIAVDSCTIVGFDYGINLIKSLALARETKSSVIGNLFYDIGEYGIYDTVGTVDTPLLMFRNAMGAIGTGRHNLGDNEEINPIVLTADPFESIGSGDFRLNSDSGGGALCRAAGVPLSFNDGNTGANYQDIGAHQHADAGGTTVMPPHIRQVNSRKKRKRR